MRHAVSMLMYNTTASQLKMSQQTFESILIQDIGDLDIYLIDNGSSLETGTADWLKSLGTEAGSHAIYVKTYAENKAPTQVANQMFAEVFAQGHNKVLGLPSDVILPRNLYRELASWRRGIVTAHMSGPLPPDLPQDHVSAGLHDDVHMSVMMTRKWAHDAVVETYGHFFDPEFFLYVSDVDLKLRLAICGIRGVQTDIMTWHYSSMWRLATPEAASYVTGRAGPDREYFARKWGKIDFNSAFSDINFRG